MTGRTVSLKIAPPKRFVRASLALGFLPSSWGSYFAKSDWLNKDESFSSGNGGMPDFERDKDLWQDVFSLIPTLGKARWQPISEAESEKGIHIERFEGWGPNKKRIYFTLYRKTAALMATNPIRLSIKKMLCQGTQLVSVNSLLTFERIKLRETTDTIEMDVPIKNENSALTVIEIHCG